MNIIKANVAAPDARVAITIARFNQFINDSLLDGAVDALTRIGQVKDDNITVVWVPAPMNCRWRPKRWRKAVNMTPWLRWEP